MKSVGIKMDNEFTKKYNLPEPDIYFPKEKKSEKEKKEEWNSEVFKDSKHTLVTNKSKNFWKVVGILFFIFLIAQASFIIYLIYDGKLQSITEIVLEPNYTIQSFNNFTIHNDNNINNEYQHDINVNTTIYVNNIMPES